jgi:hypothetical protein
VPIWSATLFAELKPALMREAFSRSAGVFSAASVIDPSFE